MAKGYTVCTGTKLKGFWRAKKDAIAYMAGRSEKERKSWKLLSFELSQRFDAEIEEAVKKLEQERSITLAERRKHHHALRAKGLTVSSSGKVKDSD